MRDIDISAELLTLPVVHREEDKIEGNLKKCDVNDREENWREVLESEKKDGNLEKREEIWY